MKDWLKILLLLIAGFAVAVVLMVAAVYWAFSHRKGDSGADGDTEPAGQLAPEVNRPGN